MKISENVKIKFMLIVLAYISMNCKSLRELVFEVESDILREREGGRK